MRDFMEKSLMRELRNGIDCYLTLASATLGISVRDGEGNLRDVEVAEGLLSVPSGEGWQFNVLAFRL